MTVHRESQGEVVILVMDHGKVNALDIELMDTLDRELDRLHRAGAPPLVITGSGASFSAGVDLFRVLDGGDAYLDGFLPQIGGLLHRLMAYPGPVVAALNGHTIAGGMVVACACDHRLMASGAGKVGVPELAAGVPFPWMALEALRRVAGPHCRELVFAGALCTPERALELGLVDRLVEPERLRDEAVALARRRGQIPTDAYRLTKAQLADPIFRSEERSAREHDERVLEIWKAPATHRWIRQFLDRTIGRS